MPDAVTHRVDNALEPDWLNAETCIENAEIYYDDSICDEDGPVDTVVSSGDLGVLIGLAKYALAARAALEAAGVAELREAAFTLVQLVDQVVEGQTGPFTLRNTIANSPAMDRLRAVLTNQGKAQADG